MKTIMFLIYMNFLGIAVLFAQNCRADDWLCTEEASQRDGNVIKACGVGLGFDENGARYQALENAKIEFDKVCNASSDCKGHEVVAEPTRTECREGELFKCYRLIQFKILPTMIQVEAEEDDVSVITNNFYKAMEKKYMWVD